MTQILNLEKLYNTFGDTLEYAFIDNYDDGCYDLLDEFDELLAMNGDEVKVIDRDEEGVVLTMQNCFDGLRFMLTNEEFEIGVETVERERIVA